MDHYKLAILCIFIASLIYWVCILIKYFVKKRIHLQVINDSYAQYLVKGDTCCHIPDEPTFNYLGSFLGFTWTDSKSMTHDEIKRKFTIGKQLPSIKLHFPKKE